MRKYKSLDFAHIKTEQDKRCYCGGIPQRYWDENIALAYAPVLFNNANGKPVSLDPQTQAAWITKLVTKEELKKPHLIIIGSMPTDEKAMALGCRIAKTALGFEYPIHVFDVGKHDYPDNKDQVLLIYNISTTAYTRDRMMKIRDAVRHNEDRFRIVVVEGNPGEFAFQHLRIRPNALFAFQGSIVTAKTL